MASYNRVVLVGRSTRDVQTKFLPSGTPVCDMGIAVAEKVKKGGDWVEEVLFVDCTAFARWAEIAGEYLQKGDPFLVEGRLKLETWEKDGEKKSKMKVIVDKLVMLGKSQQQRETERQSSSGQVNHSRNQQREDSSERPPSTRRGPAPLIDYDDPSVPF